MTKKKPPSAQRPQRRIFSAISAISAVAFIFVTAGGWFWWRRAAAPAIAPGACRGCNVLLITIDTLRLDRVGAFGGRQGLTPHLDRLAAEGLRLTHAYSAAPLTLPSHASILTAVSPPVHGLRANGLFRLSPRLPTLATVLKGAGYRTGAFVGAFVLDARFGLNRGFDVYDDRYGEKPEGDAADGAERRAEEVVKPATAWIVGRDLGPDDRGLGLGARGSGLGAKGSDRRGSASPQSPAPSPWFAWVHLYDPHEPYRAPEPYASQHEPYDAEVAYTDAMVGRLLADLRAAGQLDRTLVTVAADHGESLGEHGERTHGVFVYEATMRVPWIIWTGAGASGLRAGGSGLGAGSSSDALVRLIDLAPTVLDLIGVAAPASFEGASIVSAVNAPGAASRAGYIEAMDANLTRNWAPLTGVATRDYKLIDLPIPELYDLRADPSETANLYTRDAARARTLESLLRSQTAAFASRGSAAEKTTLSADARQRLQALGYVASSADSGARTYTDADDPKRLVSVADDLNRALATFNSGSRETGLAAVREITRTHPSFTTAFGVYASMLRDTGKLAEAIATLEDVVRRRIADQSVMVVLAGYLQEAGAPQRALALLQAVVSAHPDYADAYNSLGVVYSRLGRHGDAQAAYRKVLELDPSSATAYENLGVDALGAGDFPAAADALTHALTLSPGLAAAHNALAAVYMRQGRVADATAEWTTALRLDPRLFDALYNVATTLYDAGRRKDARPYLERFVREAPPARYGADIARLRRLLIRR
jgi:arylsulfatase A-like enzyme/Flp pilus assembly protein TadD